MNNTTPLAIAIAVLFLTAGITHGTPPDPNSSTAGDISAAATAELFGEFVPRQIDTGFLTNPSQRSESVFDIVVGEPGAGWLRVFFGAETRLHPGAKIRLTSLEDGAVQHLSNETLRQWRNSSAYFNGSQVRIELVAPASGERNRLAVRGVLAGTPGSVQESICGPTDDRILSQDPRAGRILSVGCTGWLINECLVSAGHCMGTATTVQFNVPLSNSDGSLNHPPPSDQYAVDNASIQSANTGIGDDWAYLGIFPNSETGLTALQAQGDRYTVASNIPTVAGQPMRVTGYGLDFSPNEHNQVQQTHAGPFQNFGGSLVEYETDARGGNSGSAVEDDTTGRAIGIHNSGTCVASPPPYNLGTAINNAGLQTALRNPQSVCASQAACNGNGVCETGEDCFNCVSDCAHNPPEVSGNGLCGNNICQPEAGEDCNSCKEDCNGRKGRNAFCCGDDVFCEDPRCTGNGNSCPVVSSPESSIESTSQGYCCGDGLCENAENTNNCALDCAPGCNGNGDCNSGEICCGNVCMPPVCNSDGDCSDGDSCTTDTCSGGGTCAATCNNTFPACGPSDGCCGPSCSTSSDPDCCVPTSSKEKGPRCSDGIDNDCDGLIDGADPDC